MKVKNEAERLSKFFFHEAPVDYHLFIQFNSRWVIY